METTEPTANPLTAPPAAQPIVDPRPALTIAAATAADALAAVNAAQYPLPTPCDDMNVEQLLEHLNMVIRRIASAGRGDELATWATDAADLRGGDYAAGFRTSIPAAEAAWTDDSLTRPTAVPWGQFPGAAVLGTYVNELTVHTWDLARATDQTIAWDDDVLQVSWAAIQGQLPDADRTAMWAAAQAHMPAGVPWEDPFKNATPIADDAPLIDRLVAWNGRRP